MTLPEADETKRISSSDLAYDLKKPCADCPFLVSTKLHKGIAGDLAELVRYVTMGRFAHTCHKTDNRSDSDEGKNFKGQPRHCAGAAAMIVQGRFEVQGQILAAVAKKKLDTKAMRAVTGLYAGLQDLATTYFKWFRDGQPEGKTGLDYHNEYRKDPPPIDLTNSYDLEGRN